MENSILMNATIMAILNETMAFSETDTWVDFVNHKIPVDSSIFSSSAHVTLYDCNSKIYLIRSLAFNGLYNNNRMNYTFSFPKCKWIGERAFAGCAGLHEIYIPECEYVGKSAFYACGIRLVYFENIKSFGVGGAVFADCSELESCYYMTDYVPISNTIPFTSSAGSQLVVFVKSSMREAFTTASGWSVYADRIVGI